MRKANIKDIMKLRKKGLTNGEIGEKLDLHPDTVSRLSRRYEFDKKELEVFEKTKVDILRDLQRRIVNSISDSDLIKLNPYQKTTMLGILIDKDRLISGQSTSNQAVLFHIVEKACRDKIDSSDPIE